MESGYIDMIFSAKGADLDTLQVTVRAFIMFIYSLILFRIAKQRFLGRSTPFDVIMGVVLGSVISRGINGSANLYSTLLIGLVFFVCHWGLTYIASRSLAMSYFLEGKSHCLMKNGIIDKQALKRHHVHEIEILESARYSAQVDSIEKIADSYLENSGKISSITKQKKFQTD